MATKLTLSSLESLTNETSFLTALNANFEAIADQVDLLLSRDGESPNTMSSNIDMNSFKILNLPAPATDYEPARLIDVTEGITGPQGPQGVPGSATLSDALDAIAADTASADKMYVWSAADAGAFQTITAAGLAILDDADAPAQRTTLGLGDCATLDVGTASSTVAAGNDSRFTAYTVTAKDATGNLALGENFLYHTSGSTHTWTLQPVATVAHPVGTQITVHNAPGGGDITLARGSGVGIYINGSVTSANGTIVAGGIITLIQVATNTWVAVGPGIS